MPANNPETAMRHRASRSPANLLRRFPRAVARPLGALAALSPVRAVFALAVALGFGTGTFVAVASVGSGAFTESGDTVTVAGRQAETTSRDGGRVGLPASESASGPESAEAGAETSPSRESQRSESPSEQEPSKDAVAGSSAEPIDPASPTPEATVPTSSPSSPDEETTPDDDTSPETSLSERSSDDGEAVFSMSASEDASFTCSLDGGGFEPCDSPASYSDLEPGWHTLAVRATDSAGNVDPTPAEVRWHVSGAPSSKR